MPDNMLKITMVKDTTLLDFLDANIADTVSTATMNTAESMKDYIQSHWSEVSPSSPGQPPAVVTGYLNNSLRLLRRGTGGRFSSKEDAIQWSLQVEAEYGAALEFGRPEINLAPRPFIKPALDYASRLIGPFLIKEFAFATAKRGTGTKALWLLTGNIIPQGLD